MMWRSSLIQEGWLEIDINVNMTVINDPPVQPIVDWLNQNLGACYGTMGAEMHADDWEFGYRIVNGDFHYVVRFATQELLERFQDHFWHGRH